MEDSRPNTTETDETDEELNNNNRGQGSTGKRSRPRRKHIYKALSSQIQFYFSDANLSKSKFTLDIIEKEGPWIPIELFLRYNKIRSLLEESFVVSVSGNEEKSLEHLTSALTKCQPESLEISEDGRKIRRVVPFEGPSPDEEERTIYVENLSSTSPICQESLTAFFSEYGRVDYVSCPKYKNSSLSKGFAFVEFGTKESAAKALQAFGASIDSQPPATKDPSTLQSIKSFQVEEKKKLTTKTDDQDLEEEEGASMEDETKEAVKGSKKKRKRKKKEFHESDLQLMTLSVMSKTAWKRLRNKYLTLQRKNASAFKQRLRKLKDEEPKEPPPVAKAELPFVPKTILRVELEDMVDDPKIYKSLVNASVSKPVKYVDVGIGNKRFHIRCDDEEQASTLLQLKDGLFCKENNLKSMTLLSGDEEVTYWSKIQKDREEKRRSKKVRPPPKRGRNKLQERMEECVNTRIVFSDE
eukprot:TRINITY_DN7098_c0_g1_i1.p1 TRINITY_DN7098_c0_g1~~TRINITY_DN7098_c0_g1_i1.p1  ORF type:complete len:469 (-),score=164.05 TRINITY_DN7098_c0_g1_i1:424-1830(-)